MWILRGLVLRLIHSNARLRLFLSPILACRLEDVHLGSKHGNRFSIGCAQSLSLGKGSSYLLGVESRLSKHPYLIYLCIILFPIPKGVIEEICKTQRKFLWSGDYEKKALPLVSWGLLELHKKLGGLGIGNLWHRNISLLFKWWWRFITEPNALWRNVVLDKYGYGAPFSLTDIVIPSNGGPWKHIFSSILHAQNMKPLVATCVRKRVGNGSSTFFWHDLWVENSPLKSSFPRLFLLSTMPNSLIVSTGFWNGSQWTWSLEWKRNLRPRDRLELALLLALLDQVLLDAHSHDSFVWTPSKKGFFSVKSLCHELDKSSPHIPQVFIKGLWRGLLPFRIKIFVWFSLMGKLNTRMKLSKIGLLPPHEALCIFCNSHVESEAHLFIHCEFTHLLWSWWFSLWDLHWCMPSSLHDCFRQWEYRGASPFFKKVWLAVFFIILWTTWKERNARIFNNTSCSTQQLCELILLRLCWWIKGRGDWFPYSSDEVLRHPQCLRQMPGSMPKPMGRVTHRPWSPPSISDIKWNVDASLDPIRNRSAIGGVLRNFMGIFRCVFSSPIPMMEINSAEVYAIFRAIKISMACEEIKTQSIIIESDSANAVAWSNAGCGGPWNLNFLLNFIRNTAKSHRNIHISHKGRSSNMVADALAKQGLRRENEFLAWM